MHQNLKDRKKVQEIYHKIMGSTESESDVDSTEDSEN